MTDRTALAEAELEYRDETTPSIYVNFPMVSGVPAGVGRAGPLARHDLDDDAVDPAGQRRDRRPSRADYAGVRYDRPGDRARRCTRSSRPIWSPRSWRCEQITEFAELGRCRGKELEHAEYRHPFIDRVSPIVLAAYVSVEDGTGLVHTAPGHGAEDYQTGRRLPASDLEPGRRRRAGSPTEPRLAWSASRSSRPIRRSSSGSATRGICIHELPFVAQLSPLLAVQEAGDLPGDRAVVHRRRSQRPARPDPQGRSTRSAGFPAGASRGSRRWSRSAPTGASAASGPGACRSRRSAASRAGTQLLTAETVRHFRDLFRSEGADAWFTRPVEQLLPPGAACPHCGGNVVPQGGGHPRRLVRVGLEPPRRARRSDFGLGYPAFMYLEGSDQHRGWFQSSILTAVGTHRQRAVRDRADARLRRR